MPTDTNPTAPDPLDQSGIYKITCLRTGKFYIGSAVRIGKRWAYHRQDLARGNHHSRHLQRAWNKYGEAAFVFEILEIVADKPDLIRIEQGYLDRLQPWRPTVGFNIASVAGSTLGVRPSPESIAKAVAKRKGRRPSPEAIEKTAAKLRGRKRPPEVGRKVSASKKGQKPSAATIAASIRRHKGSRLSMATRKRMSEAVRLRMSTPEGRTRMGAITGRSRRAVDGQMEFQFGD